MPEESPVFIIDDLFRDPWLCMCIDLFALLIAESRPGIIYHPKSLYFGAAPSDYPDNL